MEEAEQAEVAEVHGEVEVEEGGNGGNAGKDGRVAGVIVVTDKIQGPFNAADEVLLKHVSALVSKELTRNSTLETLRRAA